MNKKCLYELFVKPTVYYPKLQIYKYLLIFSVGIVANILNILDTNNPNFYGKLISASFLMLWGPVGFIRYKIYELNPNNNKINIKISILYHGMFLLLLMVFVFREFKSF